jgi:HK97 family phage portal protein
MRKLVKRMPRFARPAGRARYSTTEGAPSSLWLHYLTSRAFNGLATDPQSALSCTPFYACAHVISEDLASLPVAVFRRKKSGGSTLVDDHRVSYLFGRSPSGPSNETTSLQWREAWIGHALTYKGGFSEIERTNDGDVFALHLMDPRTEPVRDADGRLFYADGANRNNRIPAANVLHLAGLGYNGLEGYGLTSLVSEAIALSRAAERYGANFFANGAEPRGFLKYPGRLKPEARTNLRESFNQMHQGTGNAHKVGILEEGMDWVQTSTDPDKSQLLAVRQFQVVEMARIFRVPPHKIGDYTQSHLANIEASNLDYLMTVLRPWCERLEQCLQLKLLTDKEYRLGYYIRHDIRALLRASIKDRAMFYQVMFQMGMSVDEIREFEDMNPIGTEAGGDARFRTANTIELLNAEARGVTGEVPIDTGAGPVTDETTQGSPGSYSARLNGHFSRENGVI